MVYTVQLDACDSEEAEAFEAELYAPLNPEAARAEKNVDRWLRGG